MVKQVKAAWRRIRIPSGHRRYHDRPSHEVEATDLLV